jgi:predicted DNA-binding protein with PD1-like motif
VAPGAFSCWFSTPAKVPSKPLRFADQEKIHRCEVTAIGAFAEARVGRFDLGAKEDKPIIVNEAKS